MSNQKIFPRRAKPSDPVPCMRVNTDPNNGESHHRCYGCGEYPELAGPHAVNVALDSSGFHWTFCANCVNAMTKALEGV